MPLHRVRVKGCTPLSSAVVEAEREAPSSQLRLTPPSGVRVGIGCAVIGLPADLQAKLTRETEESFDHFGDLHMLFRRWHRETWPAGPPRRGTLVRVSWGLPDDIPTAKLESVGGIGHEFGLELARREAALFFDPGHASDHSARPDELDSAVRSAIRSCTARGLAAAVFLNFEDEHLLPGLGAVAWDGVAQMPVTGCWGTWHRQPVVLSNLTRPGMVWVAGDVSARLHVYPDQPDAGRVALVLIECGAGRSLEARVWCEFTHREPRTLHRIEIVTDAPSLTDNAR